MKLTVAQPIKRNRRWIWVIFFLFVVLPLYVIAITVFVRSGLFRLKGGSLSNDQLKAVWTFLAAGLAASATILGALLTKSYNDRNLAAQNLNTVVSTLGLISKDGEYSTSAATAAGLATLVQLGHPIVAMRALRPAFEDKAVDPDTFTWLISQVLTSDTTVGTARDLADAKEQAAALLSAFAGKRLIFHDNAQFSWPDAITARWPSGLSPNAALNVMYAMADLLTSEKKEWWIEQGTFTWIIYTLDEIVRCDRSQNIRMNAASFGLAILKVTDDDNIQGLNDTRSKSEVAKRMGSQKGASTDRIDQNLLEKIYTWGFPNPPS